ncbi:MAG: cell division protein FtsL [Mariprofundaceae bacterium]|nr:cell division protein FtsL [Mariprofundaceae bacterium]
MNIIPKITWQRSLLFLICVALLAIAQVGLSFMRNNLATNIQKQEQKKIKTQANITQLKLELASLKRPERLRALAQENLDMHSPMPHQIIQP